MSMANLHPWILDPDQAIRIQESLRHQLILAWDGRKVHTIGGVEVNYTGEFARAAITILDYPGLAIRTTVSADAPLVFPYIPGLLAFRIGPTILATWDKLAEKPDLVLFHGHGTAHPLNFGLASHLGLWIQRPTIGIARRRLYGRHEEVGPKAGNWTELWDEHDPGRVIGSALRTRENASPVYASPGHLIDLEHAVEFTLECCRGHRMPEPLRIAHQIASLETLQ